MDACMYVGMHACMYVCMYACMHVCVYARTCVALLGSTRSRPTGAIYTVGGVDSRRQNNSRERLFSAHAVTET